MIIFTLRRLLLLLITLFLLTFVGFSLSYFTPHAPLQGASLWNAWLFWFEGVLHKDGFISRREIESAISSTSRGSTSNAPWPAISESAVVFEVITGTPVA